MVTSNAWPATSGKRCGVTYVSKVLPLHLPCRTPPSGEALYGNGATQQQLGAHNGATHSQRATKDRGAALPQLCGQPHLVKVNEAQLTHAGPQQQVGGVAADALGVRGVPWGGGIRVEMWCGVGTRVGCGLGPGVDLRSVHRPVLVSGGYGVRRFRAAVPPHSGGMTTAPMSAEAAMDQL